MAMYLSIENAIQNNKYAVNYVKTDTWKNFPIKQKVGFCKYSC